MNLKDKRKQFNSKAFKRYLRSARPLIECCNCGAKERLVWHHIVPLAVGGLNTESNIAVVCERCHVALHNAKNAQLVKLGERGGRKAKPLDVEILDRYTACEIGREEAERLLGVHRLCELEGYKRYKAERGIVEFRNNVDILNAPKNNGARPTRPAGYIRYKGDTEKTFLYVSS